MTKALLLALLLSVPSISQASWLSDLPSAAGGALVLLGGTLALLVNVRRRK